MKQLYTVHVIVVEHSVQNDDETIEQSSRVTTVHNVLLAGPLRSFGAALSVADVAVLAGLEKGVQDDD